MHFGRPSPLFRRTLVFPGFATLALHCLLLSFVVLDVFVVSGVLMLAWDFVLEFLLLHFSCISALVILHAGRTSIDCVVSFGSVISMSEA